MSDGLITTCRDYWRAAQAQEGVVWPDEFVTPAVDFPTPAVIAGVNQLYAVLTFPDAAVASIHRAFRLPPDVYLPGGLAARLLWSTPATSGSVRWAVETAFADVDGDLDPAFNAPDEVVSPAGASADTLQKSDFAALDTTGAVAGALMFLRITRDATDSDDDLVDDVHLIGVEFQYQRRMVLPGRSRHAWGCGRR